MDTDSDVGNDTKWDGLPDDIASDGGDGGIAAENGNFLGDDEDENDWLSVVFAEPAGRVSAWYEILRVQKKEDHLGLGGSKKCLANVGIEPKTFALLARRSNQLS